MPRQLTHKTDQVVFLPLISSSPRLADVMLDSKFSKASGLVDSDLFAFAKNWTKYEVVSTKVLTKFVGIINKLGVRPTYICESAQPVIRLVFPASTYSPGVRSEFVFSSRRIP